MYKYGIHIGFLSLLISMYTCEGDIYYPSQCDQEIKIDEEQFKNGPDDVLEIHRMEIEGDCLVIKFSSGGCDGSSWMIELIDSGEIMESYPEQRRIRLSLRNEELCDAYISRELSFNLSPIRTNGNAVWLVLVNSGDRILYEY